jgi:sterol desaturase/sphingolipid hydroxylase (fatty acid hydroxylase superfamily)
VGELRTWLTSDTFGAAAFPVAFLFVAVWESIHPARQMTIEMSHRWFGNIVLMLASLPVIAFLPFFSALGGAVFAREYGVGFFNIASAPAALVIPLSFVLLDLVGYWEHRLFHSTTMLWRLHALHHSDPDLDVTTVVRHHPVEMLVQAGFDAAVALIFGFPPEAIALYTATMSVVQVVHHGNIQFPKPMQWMSWVIVTPELHRLHHSVLADENNSNFSNVFSIWDRIFGTIRMRSSGELRVGLTEFASLEFQRLNNMLMFPLLVGR